MRPQGGIISNIRFVIKTLKKKNPFIIQVFMYSFGVGRINVILFYSILKKFDANVLPCEYSSSNHTFKDISH